MTYAKNIPIKNENQKKRGRPSKPPRIVVNRKRGGLYDIVDKGRRLALHVSEYDLAHKELNAYLKRKQTGFETRHTHVKMHDVFLHPSNERRYINPGLKRFWSTLRLSDVDYSNCEKYMLYRMNTHENEGRVASLSTVFIELTNLKTMVRDFCKDRAIDPIPEVYRPKVPGKRRPFVKAHEVHRLLQAAEGYIWSAADQQMILPLEDDDPSRKYEHIYRLILFCIYTGSRVKVVLEAKWHDDGESSWVDLENGLFYRRGSREADHSNKKRPTVRMTKELMEKSKGWKQNDLFQNHKYVLHKENGEKLSDYNDHFHRVRKSSGLGSQVTVRVLRSSCAIWLMEGGMTIEEAAGFLGNTSKILSSSYDHYAPEFSFAAADALDSRAY